MSWSETLWSACSYITEVSLTATYYTFDSIGSLVCFIGGVGYTSSHALDETAHASYLGVVKSSGSVNFAINARQFGYQLNETEHFSRYDRMDWGNSYQLVDYLNPQMIQMYCGICILTGTALKVLSSNIKLIRDGLTDKRRYENEDDVPVLFPRYHEFLTVTTGSLARSLALTAYGVACAGIVIECSGLVGANKNVTYPSEGTAMSGKNYSGPVTSTFVPMEFRIAKNVTFKWPLPQTTFQLPPPFNYTYTLPIKEFNVLLELVGKAHGLLNATYGGGVNFKSNSPSNTPFIAAGMSFGVAASIIELTMFSRAKKSRDERVHDARVLKLKERIQERESFFQKHQNGDMIEEQTTFSIV